MKASKKTPMYLYDHMEEIIIVACIVASVILVFLQVIMRYVFNNSLTWSEEVARFLFVWESYLGISIGAKKGQHITVDLVMQRFKGKTRLVMATVSELLVMAICIVFMYEGIRVVDHMYTMESMSPALGIPMGFMYAAVPVGCGLMIMRTIESLYLMFKYRADSLQRAEMPEFVQELTGEVE